MLTLTLPKLLFSMFPPRYIPLPHLNYRGPVNFLRWPLSEDIRQRILSKLPRLQNGAIFLTIPHPRACPLVRNYVLKPSHLPISFSLRLLIFIAILDFSYDITDIGSSCVTSSGSSLFLPNIQCATVVAKFKGNVACC